MREEISVHLTGKIGFFSTIILFTMLEQTLFMYL